MWNKYHLLYVNKDGFICAYREFESLREAKNRRDRDIKVYVKRLGLSLKIVGV